MAHLYPPKHSTGNSQTVCTIKATLAFLFFLLLLLFMFCLTSSMSFLLSLILALISTPGRICLSVKAHGRPCALSSLRLSTYCMQLDGGWAPRTKLTPPNMIMNIVGLICVSLNTVVLTKITLKHESWAHCKPQTWTACTMKDRRWGFVVQHFHIFFLVLSECKRLYSMCEHAK